MKRMVQSFAIILVLLMASASVIAQESTQVEADKKKQEELTKLKEADAQKKKQDELTKLKEFEVQKKMQQVEQDRMRVEKSDEYERAIRDYDEIRKRAEEMSTGMPMVVFPEDKVFRYAVPHQEDFFIYNNMPHSGKPGSSWNYTRQVLEATFTNEFTMDAGGDDGSVNLSVSGNCAEGSISVAIIMPDGKQLSEVLIDENGSLNWRKNLEENEGSKWKDGKWIFKIKAKDATGNFLISMNTN
jgi:hypothetical protein